MEQASRVSVFALLLLGIGIIAHHASLGDTIEFDVSDTSIRTAADNSPDHHEPAELPPLFENQLSSGELPICAVIPAPLHNKVAAITWFSDDRGIELPHRLEKPPRIASCHFIEL